MMMQMLAAGGLRPLTDGARPADGQNERGYFEHSAVKGLRRDASFLGEARGRAVKIIAQLLPFVPRSPNRNYRACLRTPRGRPRA